MTMLEIAFGILKSNPDRAFTLDELRRLADISLRSQYRLSQQLTEHPQVTRLGNARFQFTADAKRVTAADIFTNPKGWMK